MQDSEIVVLIVVSHYL